MKRDIFEFIKDHPYTTHHIVARELRIEELDAMRLMHELYDNGFLRVDIVPLGNSIDPDSSSFYSACKVSYEGESEVI